MTTELIKNLFSEQSKDLLTLLNDVDSLLRRNIHIVDTSDLIDEELLAEVTNTSKYENVCLYFGKTLRELKLVLQDDEGLRKHDILIQYTGPKKLIISSVNLPRSYILNNEYTCIEEVIQAISKRLNELARYFYELEVIDQSCAIMEPLNPSFKDDYRRILLDDRTWLHVEVTPEGYASNVHLIGQSEYWHDKLQTGLLSWDHDKHIVDNIMTIFELESFRQLVKFVVHTNSEEQEKSAVEIPVCGICLCEELPDVLGVPQPLCQNPACGSYCHRQCLFQWLVACAGSRAPAFGVASGSCPTCLQPIMCNENDN